VRIVVAHLLDAAPDLWRGLLEDPDYRVRRRALAQALELRRCDSAHLLALAVCDPDVLVAQRAAEHPLHVLVPPGTETPATPQTEAAIRKLLASRVPGVRAASVTVLRRAQRPDLAAPFTADRSAQVREVACWVLRKHGQDPMTACRARLARPAEEITPGAVAGLAECGDHTDVPLLRAQLTHQRSKVRAAALYSLGTMKPPAITTPELLVVMDHDPAPGVLRTAVALLERDRCSGGDQPAGEGERSQHDGLGRQHPGPLRARGQGGTDQPPQALLRASPAFVSTEDLLEQAWDEHADPFTNTVTVTVGRLRRKLGAPPVITTTPTVGYRIADPPATAPISQDLVSGETPGKSKKPSSPPP
jgi:hypothetical protein